MQRFSLEYDVPEDKLRPFFQNEFLRCEIGKADLKEELVKYLPQWGYKQPVEELLNYWFRGESQVDKDVTAFIQDLQAQGVNCFLATNNEKHRALYLISEVGLGEIFNGVFTSAHLGYFKSQPEFWQKAYNFELMGNKHEVLAVDDNEAVVSAARNFGFYAHLYQSLDKLKQEVQRLMSL